MYETFKELQDRAKYILTFNSKQMDGDFSPAVIAEAVNSAYEIEWNRVLDTADLEVTELSYDTIWPGGQLQLPMPAALIGLRLNDIMILDSSGYETQLVCRTDGAFFYWDPQGPDSTTNIRFKYGRTAGKMVQDSDKPVLFPKNHREFLAWAAAIQLKGIADQEIPKFFTDTYNDLRASALKATESVLANQRHQYTRIGGEVTDYVNFDPQ